MPAVGVGLLVDHVLLGLMQAVLGGFQGEIVLACDDGGQQGIAADLELGEFDVGLGRFEHGVARFLFAWPRLVGFGLDDLLLGFGEIGLGFAEVEFLLGGVELDDDIACVRPVRRVRGGR